MSATQKPQYKLNILALPNQTTLLFGLMVTVLLGTILIGSLDCSPVLTWPLALGMLLLPLRAFLAQPERFFERAHLAPAGEAYESVQSAIDVQARKIGLSRSPGLLISPASGALYTFGTFRRWYLVAGGDVAQDLCRKLAHAGQTAAANAQILHELYHFKNGDHWKMGYTGELVHTTFQFMSWALAFSLGLGLLLTVAASAFAQLDPVELVGNNSFLTPEMQLLVLQMFPVPEEMAEVQQKAGGVNFLLVLNFILSALLPLVIAALVLWRLYWPRLWRTREFYADAGVAQAQGSANPLRTVLLAWGVPVGQEKRPEQFLEHIKDAWTAFTLTLRPGFSQNGALAPKASLPVDAGDKTPKDIKQFFTNCWRFARGLASFHPELSLRLCALEDPGRVFGTWRNTAILVGSLALLLDILLSSPLRLMYVGNWPMHFSTLVIFVTVSIGYLIPAVAQGKSNWGDVVKIVATVAAIRLSWLLPALAIMVLLLFLAPELLAETLSLAVASVAHYAGNAPLPGFDDLPDFVAQAAYFNLAQVVIIFLVLLVTLNAAAFVLRRLFTWYSLPHTDRRLLNLAYLFLGCLLALCGLTILPLATNALLRPDELLQPAVLLAGLVGLAIFLSGASIFVWLDRMFAHKCPRCGERIPGYYEPAKSCSACQDLLFPWLLVEYES